MRAVVDSGSTKLARHVTRKQTGNALSRRLQQTVDSTGQDNRQDAAAQSLCFDHSRTIYMIDIKWFTAISSILLAVLILR